LTGRTACRWSLSCFYVRKGCRGQGVALKAAKSRRGAGARSLPARRRQIAERHGHRLRLDVARAGFKTVACRAPPRPVMRHDLKAIG